MLVAIVVPSSVSVVRSRVFSCFYSALCDFVRVFAYVRAFGVCFCRTVWLPLC